MTIKYKRYWETNEKILGLLGVAPYATIDFLQKISDLTPAAKDWDHVRIILDNNIKIPSRGRALELGEESPVKYIRKSIKGLKYAGADFVVILCNTAHIFYDEVTSDLNIQVLNMVSETLEYILLNNTEISSIGVLGSNNTVKYKLYNKYCPKDSPIRIYYPTEQQKLVAEIIESIKQGKSNSELKRQLIQIAKNFIKNSKIEALIIGCTELSTLLKNGDLKVPVFDSNEILARVAIRKIKLL